MPFVGKTGSHSSSQLEYKSSSSPMSSTRLQPHHSLPAPVVHATFSTQSKSHVLAGVQDAYWSDDEAEDADCPLCLEEMDISDLNFKPCICGYQICRFCWHHIKENLNKRCPACRRIYTDDAVEFKPIATQDHKRLTQQKKQRDRERKELDALGRRSLANVRVVQRNIVYVVGLGPRFAKEELIPTLRSNEYFGQYGKITKILLVKRNSPGGGGPVVGLYITYQRREDAARAIAAVDGTHSPGGSRDVMRASYGTTKYCMAFLRGVTCSDHSCMNLHEWGDEKDCFTKEDLTTLKHTMKATESRTRVAPAKRTEENAPLPRAASWAAQKSPKSPHSVIQNTQTNMNSGTATTPTRSRRGGTPRQPRNASSSAAQDSRFSQTKAHAERKHNFVSVSRPSTPVMEPSITPHDDLKGLRPKELLVSVQPSTSPTLSPTASDRSGFQDRTSSTHTRPDSVESTSSNLHLTSSGSANTSLLVPPGLSAPPGIPSLSRPPRAETASPQTPLLASQSSYQMSIAARALLDDVKARRESTLPASSSFSPFPDFDRTLQTLTDEGGGGFSFNLDPKLADEAEVSEPLPDFDLVSTVPFHGSYIEAFPALRSGFGFNQPPSGYVHNTNPPIYDPATLRTGSGHSFEEQSTRGTGYTGLFNPFSEPGAESVSTSSSSYPLGDEERKVSRFGFAQGRKASTVASHSPLSNPSSHASQHQSFYHPTDVQHDAGYQWSTDYHEHLVSNSHATSAQVQHAQAQTMFPHAQNRLPSGRELSEAQLRNFIQSSQARLNDSGNHGNINGIFASNLSSQPFEDPAIMSASFGALGPEHIFTPMTHGPPPGLPAPQGILSHSQQNDGEVPTIIASPSSTALFQEDFPALLPISSDSNLTPASLGPTPVASSKSRENADRRAAKKAAAAAEKAVDRRKLVQGKAFEKGRAAKDKATEKEILSAPKPQLVSSPKAILVQDPVEVRTVDVPSPSDYRSEIAKESSLVNSNKTTPIKKSVKPSDLSATNKRLEPTVTSPKSFTHPKDYFLSRQTSEISQLPLLSKKPKKTKPVVKTVKTSKDDEVHDEVHDEDLNVHFPHEISHAVEETANPSSSTSRSQSLDRHSSITSVEDLLEGLDVSSNPFFDVQRLTAPAKMPLEYGPLVHALSVSSVGGTSTMPSGSIDNAVSSFQQLLETLTQTISELLRLLPRTTWDDSSSFNGVFHDMLKGDDFLDDGEDSSGKDDEVAALTLALERRARWMEVQLSKLEELHRDINTAAVRAILSFNDNGWDQHTFLPRIGNTLLRFDHIALVKEGGALRPMTADELEKKLAVAKEAAIFAETEIREAMERFQYQARCA